jgi:hypothetical protein
MRTWFLVAVLGANACASSRDVIYVPANAQPESSASETPSELEMNLAAYLGRGDGQIDKQGRARALVYLVDHGDEAQPRLLPYLQGDRPNLYAAMALAMIGSADSVGPLVAAMRHADPMTAEALRQIIAAHKHPDARAALQTP